MAHTVNLPLYQSYVILVTFTWKCIMIPKHVSRQLLRLSVISFLGISTVFLYFYPPMLTLFENQPEVSRVVYNRNPDQSRFHQAKRRVFTSRLYINDEDKMARLSRGQTLWNYTHIIDTFLSQPTCINASIIVVITSAPENLIQREAIRETWCSDEVCLEHLGKNGLLCQCVFLIGKTNDHKTKAQVMKEVHNYGDVLWGYYMDTYRNLSLKVLSGFYWITHQCKPDYILKTDDDCFVNTKVFLEFINVQVDKPKHLYVGNIFSTERHTQVIRDPTSKWSLHQEDYAPDHYPPYASGTGYVLSSDVVQQVLDMCRLFKPFPNEDAYIGVLTNYLGIEPTHSYRFTLISEKWKTCNFRYLLVIHHVNTDLQQEMMDLVHKAVAECEDQPLLTTWS